MCRRIVSGGKERFQTSTMLAVVSGEEVQRAAANVFEEIPELVAIRKYRGQAIEVAERFGVELTQDNINLIAKGLLGVEAILSEKKEAEGAKAREVLLTIKGMCDGVELGEMATSGEGKIENIRMAELIVSRFDDWTTQWVLGRALSCLDEVALENVRRQRADGGPGQA